MKPNEIQSIIDYISRKGSSSCQYCKSCPELSEDMKTNEGSPSKVYMAMCVTALDQLSRWNSCNRFKEVLSAEISETL